MTLTSRISLVVPCKNESEAIAPFVARVDAILDSRPDSSAPAFDVEFVFVDDGSDDATLKTLTTQAIADPRIVVVELSRNFGKEAALTAGIDHATGDAVIPIDVDMQDPPELILEMVGKWREGFDVVLAQRRSRATDTAGKRWAATLFYRLHNRLSDLKLPENVGDFRLMDRAVVEQLKRMPERRRFMKGLFAWLGFRTAVIEYDRPSRTTGTTKFSVWRLWNLALEGITSFSTIPLRAWTYVGLLISIAALAYGTFIIVKTMYFGIDVPGYASIFTAVLFFGGLQLISLGVIGEYIGRTYEEAKGRPIYVVRRLHKTGNESATVPHNATKLSGDR